MTTYTPSEAEIEAAPRAGDIVAHGPTGEQWVVAYVDGEYLGWCGWPEGEAKLTDCTIVTRCADAEHLDWLRQIGDPKRTPDKRQRMAQAAHPACRLAQGESE